MAVLYEMVGGIMEILTLLKANILRKKGTFICIMLLTAIVDIVMTTIFSIKDNYNAAIEDAIEYSDCGEIVTIITPQLLSDELRSKVEGHQLVERVAYYNAICSNGTWCGEEFDGNSMFLTEQHDGIRLLNENEDGYTEKIPKLKQGEIYLPLGLKPKLSCNVGDSIKIDFIRGVSEEFTIKGFVEEITFGSMNMGWKEVFISNEDYVRILEDCKPLATGDIVLETVIMRIHKSSDTDLSAAKFQRKLNLDTGIVSSSIGAMNIEQSVHYTKILTDVVLNIVLAFAVFLFIIVLIVMSHSIGTEIEIDYTALGVLKSQGFTKGKIRLLFVLRYVLAEVMGIFAGNIASIPIERKITGVCQEITGVLSEKGLSIGKCLLFSSVIIFVSAVLILIKTIKIAKISPVRAISGGREEVFFDSRINVPINKKALWASLSLRQFTSAKKRYAGTIFIAAILTFCMITVNLTGNILTSRNALSAMGIVVPDLTVYYTKADVNIEWEEVDKLVEENSQIKEKNSSSSIYASLNGENLFCEIYEYPEYAHGIIKGRAPLYENEIMITEIVEDLLDIKMGDEVTVTFKDKENTFIISGIYQSEHDTGMSFYMNFEGAKRNGRDINNNIRYYELEDKSKTDIIIDKIIARYGDMLSIDVYDDSTPVSTQYDQIVSLLKLIIYTFSILFAFVVIRMVCTKSFVQERTIIGVYKALGFTSNMLRLQFAVRFLIMALVGETLGVILSMLFSSKTLSLCLSLTGLTKVVIEYTAMTLIVPIAVISLSFFVFSYVASWKIKSVEIRELVTE